MRNIYAGVRPYLVLASAAVGCLLLAQTILAASDSTDEKLPARDAAIAALIPPGSCFVEADVTYPAQQLEQATTLARADWTVPPVAFAGTPVELAAGMQGEVIADARTAAVSRTDASGDRQIWMYSQSSVEGIDSWVLDSVVRPTDCAE
jgi:hypothetical protein